MGLGVAGTPGVLLILFFLSFPKLFSFPTYLVSPQSWKTRPSLCAGGAEHPEHAGEASS